MGSDIIDSKGDKWRVRRCDDDDDCVVLTHILVKCDATETDPDSLHIPRSAVLDIAEQLTQILKELPDGN